MNNVNDPIEQLKRLATKTYPKTFEQTTEWLDQETIDEFCVYIDACAGYYHTENEGFYNLEGEYQGLFEKVWGDHPHGFDPESFGLDEGEYHDLHDITFWTIRDTDAYKRTTHVDHPDVLSGLIDYFCSEEGIDQDMCSFSIGEEIDPKSGHDILVISGFHSKVGPVWSTASKVITFPTDYVTVSNAFLDMANYILTIQNLTYGCGSCWRTQNISPVEEIADEFGCSENLAEDLMDACDTNELKFLGPIQPDCQVCYGAGVNIMGGPDAL